MEFDHNIPIYVQVIHQIKKDIVNGKLGLGDKLPSGRELALQFQINPNTANRIYKELEMLDICFTKRGLGTFVTEHSEKVTELREEMAEEYLVQFMEGMKHLGYQKEELIGMINAYGK